MFDAQYFLLSFGILVSGLFLEETRKCLKLCNAMLNVYCIVAIIFIYLII